MNLLANGKTFAICREHRITYSGKSCPKCATSKREEERLRLRHERALEEIAAGRWTPAQWEEARRNAKEHGIFAPGIIRDAEVGDQIAI